jgi:GNAT superfamily N-acetyltransferase
MEIVRSRVADVMDAPAFQKLAAEYEAEALIDGMPAPAARFEAYEALETAGMLHVFAATVEGGLVGFISVLVASLPRYGRPIAVSESFFVAKEHRKTGAGLRLLKAAENEARARGCPGLLVSAPADGTLSQVLPRVGFRESSRIFFKRLADA